MAALTLMVVACNPDEKKGNEIDWNKVTVNGFYVAGPATGFDEISGDCVMAAGYNEADKAARDGMYEKYIVLEADKEFYLLFNDGGNKSRYSAALQEFTTPEDEAYAENPAKVFKGALVKGDDAPAMKVNKTGLYHIVLDINKTGDLDAAGGAQILLLDASAFQMKGAFGEAESDPAPASFSNKDGVTFTYKGVKLMSGAWFKFRTGDYWKVTLDDAGKVKAEVSLGDGMSQNGGDCKMTQSGIYDVTLKFKLAGGGFDRSFTMTTELKEELSEMPEWAGIYGDYSGHNWNADGAEPVKIGSKKGESGTGVFKGVVTMVGGTGFKVFANDVWYGGSMDDLSDDGGAANLVMAEEGTFYVEIDLASETKTIKFTKITRVGVIGDALADEGANSWSSDVELVYDEEKHVFSAPVEFAGDGSFKIRFNNGWDYNYGGTLEAPVFDGDNITGPDAGTYTVTADFTDTAVFTVVEGVPGPEAPFASHFGINWATIECGAEGSTEEGKDAVKAIKATADAAKVYVCLEVAKTSLYYEMHEYANRSYLCISDGTGTSDRWAMGEGTKVEGWLMYKAEPYYINWNDIVVEHRAYAATVDDVVYFEMALDRSKVDCLKTTKAYLGFFETDTYNDGSTAGSRAEIGYAPAKGGDLLEVTLPAFGE